jgi:hypothetical protein
LADEIFLLSSDVLLGVGRSRARVVDEIFLLSFDALLGVGRSRA